MSKDARTTGPIEVRPTSSNQDREVPRGDSEICDTSCEPCEACSAPTPLDVAPSSYWEAAVETCERTPGVSSASRICRPLSGHPSRGIARHSGAHGVYRYAWSDAQLDLIHSRQIGRQPALLSFSAEWSELVPQTKPSMSIPSTDVSSRRSIATKHLRRPPAHQPHEVGLTAPTGVPPVRCGVAKLVRVQVLDADLSAPAVQHLPDPVIGQRATPLLPQPQLPHGRPPIPLPQP